MCLALFGFESDCRDLVINITRNYVLFDDLDKGKERREEMRERERDDKKSAFSPLFPSLRLECCNGIYLGTKLKLYTALLTLFICRKLDVDLWG